MGITGVHGMNGFSSHLETFFALSRILEQLFADKSTSVCQYGSDGICKLHIKRFMSVRIIKLVLMFTETNACSPNLS
jgi:hypothetical protein